MLFSVDIFRVRCQNSFCATGEFAACQHDPVPAIAAFQTYVSSQAGHFPLEPAAGVWFAHAYDGVDLQVRKHIIL